MISLNIFLRNEWWFNNFYIFCILYIKIIILSKSKEQLNAYIKKVILIFKKNTCFEICWCNNDWINLNNVFIWKVFVFSMSVSDLTCYINYLKKNNNKNRHISCIWICLIEIVLFHINKISAERPYHTFVLHCEKCAKYWKSLKNDCWKRLKKILFFQQYIIHYT